MIIIAILVALIPIAVGAIVIVLAAWAGV